MYSCAKTSTGAIKIVIITQTPINKPFITYYTVERLLHRCVLILTRYYFRCLANGHLPLHYIFAHDCWHFCCHHFSRLWFHRLRGYFRLHSPFWSLISSWRACLTNYHVSTFKLFSIHLRNCSFYC